MWDTCLVSLLLNFKQWSRCSTWTCQRIIQRKELSTQTTDHLLKFGQDILKPPNRDTDFLFLKSIKMWKTLSTKRTFFLFDTFSDKCTDSPCLKLYFSNLDSAFITYARFHHTIVTLTFHKWKLTGTFCSRIIHGVFPFSFNVALLPLLLL